jgi:hypothetical protein
MLEASDWAKALPTGAGETAKLDDLADCYYVSPYISYFRHLASELGYKDHLPRTLCRFELAPCIAGAVRYGEQYKEDEMGEKARKMEGINSSLVYKYKVDEPFSEFKLDIDSGEQDD